MFEFKVSSGANIGKFEPENILIQTFYLTLSRIPFTDIKVNEYSCKRDQLKDFNLAFCLTCNLAFYDVGDVVYTSQRLWNDIVCQLEIIIFPSTRSIFKCNCNSLFWFPKSKLDFNSKLESYSITLHMVNTSSCYLSLQIAPS